MTKRNGLKLAIGAFCIFLIYQPAVYYTVWWGIVVVVGDVFDLRFPPRPESAAGSATTDDVGSGGYPNSVDAPWVNAIERRDLAAVKRLLDSGADIEQRLYMRSTPAIYAAFGEGWDIVLILLQNGADPAAVDDQGSDLAKLAKTSRVAPDNEYGRALAEVKKILTSKGLM